MLPPVPAEGSGSEASVMAESGVGPPPLYSPAPSRGGTSLPAGTISGAEGLGCVGGTRGAEGKGRVGDCGARSKRGDSVPSSACWTTGLVDGVSKAGEGGCAASNSSATRRSEVVFERASSNRVGKLRDLKQLVKQLVKQLPGIVKDGLIELLMSDETEGSCRYAEKLRSCP